MLGAGRRVLGVGALTDFCHSKFFCDRFLGRLEALALLGPGEAWRTGPQRWAAADADVLALTLAHTLGLAA